MLAISLSVLHEEEIASTTHCLDIGRAGADFYVGIHGGSFQTKEPVVKQESDVVIDQRPAGSTAGAGIAVGKMRRSLVASVIYVRLAQGRVRSFEDPPGLRVASALQSAITDQEKPAE